MIRIRNRVSLLVIIAGLLLALLGCKKNTEPPPPSAPTAHPATAKSPATPVQRQFSSAASPSAGPARLDFANRKDPFRPYLQPKAEKNVALRARPANLLPIQSYSVEQFRVTGIIAGLRENKALVVDPAGKGYVVKTGMNIGSNNGVITKIGPSFIEVAEKYRDDAGKTKKRLVKLSLAKKQ